MFLAFLPTDGEFFELQFPFNQAKWKLSPRTLSPFTTGWSKDHQKIIHVPPSVIDTVNPSTGKIVPGSWRNDGTPSKKLIDLGQCLEMTKIHPTMQKDSGMSTNNILTVKVKLPGSGTNACNIFLWIQKVEYFEICYKKLLINICHICITPENPWHAFLQVTNDKIWVCLTVQYEKFTKIWLGELAKFHLVITTRGPVR